MDHLQEYERLRGLVNGALEDCFLHGNKPDVLKDAMRYSLLAGGKRIRPILMLAFCRASGGSEAECLGAACGIEMLHTYSLIHDDLPCMDNDDLRRGRPTCHKAFGETNAVLAGDALQAEAFLHVLRSSPDPERNAAMAAVLAEAAGADGMCAGQYLDTSLEGQPLTVDELRRIHSLKTGALLRAACVMGVACAGGTAEQVDAAADFAMHLGLAFQIRDDVLDRISSTEELGKPVGSDEAEGKTTFYSLLGEAECERLVREHTALAGTALSRAFDDTSFILWLAERLAVRKK